MVGVVFPVVSDLHRRMSASNFVDYETLHAYFCLLKSCTAARVTHLPLAAWVKEHQAQPSIISSDIDY